MESDELLFAHLENQRQHVLDTVAGLSEHDMQLVVVPSDWSIVRMLNHLTHDDEMFWGCAVLGADQDAIDALSDGWTRPAMSGVQAIGGYRAMAERSRELQSDLDLDAPPRWWPPAEVFDAPPMATARQVVFRLLAETSVHAGHLDVARELIDGQQYLVVN